MLALSKSLWAFLWVLLGIWGCASGAATSAGTGSPPDATAPTSSGIAVEDAGEADAPRAESTESSVHPGINDHYFRPDGPERYTRILEAETREIVQRSDDIVAAIGLRNGADVADIGAGTGLLTSKIAEAVGKRGHVYAVDIVPEFLDTIRTRIEADGLSNVSVVRGEERATALEAGTLDVAFMCDTYHHLEYPGPYMRSVFETLRPGSTLVVVDMKRVDGESSPGVLKHVRAGKATVIAEIERAGFRFESETDLLKENYYLYFRRP